MIHEDKAYDTRSENTRREKRLSEEERRHGVGKVKARKGREKDS